MQEEKHFDWGALIVGIILIVLGFWSFMKPDKSLALLSILVGVGAVIKGIYELVIRSTVNRLFGARSGWLIVMGILDLVMGFIFIFRVNTGVMTIAIIFAIWFIMDCIGQLSMAGFFRIYRPSYYWLVILLNVIGLMIGVALLFNPMLSALTIVWLISSFLIVLGILAIVAAF